MTDEIRILQQQIAEMQRDLERQKREIAVTKRQPVWTGAALTVALLVLAGTQGRTKPPLGALQCREVQIIGRDGHTQAILGTDVNGGYLNVRGTDGRFRAFLGCSSHGGEVNIRGNDGKLRANLTSGLKGGFLSVHGNDGKERAAVISYGPHDTGTVYVVDASGTVQRTLP